MKFSNKEGCVFPMIVGSILPHAKFGPIDHRDPLYIVEDNLEQLKILT